MQQVFAERATRPRLFHATQESIAVARPRVINSSLSVSTEDGQGGDTVPNIKSAEKRVRVSAKRTLRNTSLKSALRTTIKKFEAALTHSDVEQARLALRVATRALDKAVTKGIIHRNTASRKKSRLTKRFNAFVASQQAAANQQ
jgi:small subunit ribosomal protein S20